MSDNALDLKTSLMSAHQVKDLKKKRDLFDRLEACFDYGHWVELSFKPKRLDDCKLAMKDFVSPSFRGVKKVKTIIKEYLNNDTLMEVGVCKPINHTTDPFLVTVTAVSSPGDFYITRHCDLDIQKNLFRSLKENADSFGVPEENEIISGQMYAVCNTSNIWFRGICGRSCGEYLCDGKSGKLYQFFLPDQGNTDNFNSLSIRHLPKDLLQHPAMAVKCTLNRKFNSSNSWSTAATLAFTQMTRRSPMSMKVFDQKPGLLEVDLQQLPCFGEDNNILSVRDALFLMGCQPSSASQELFPEKLPEKIKPRFSEATQPKQFLAVVTSPYMPNNIYVQVLGEEMAKFHSMQEELQRVFRDVDNDSPSYVTHPIKGINLLFYDLIVHFIDLFNHFSGYCYAIKYSNDNIWYRVLIEDISNDYLIFYVDTGHRNYVSRPECHQLPEK